MVRDQTGGDGLDHADGARVLFHPYVDADHGSLTIQNILTHVVVPAASILDFFVTGVYSRIKVKYLFFVVIPPLLYAVYAGIGYVLGWQFSLGKNYPYFFLNWGSPAGAFGFTNELPFMGSGWWIIALLILLLVIGLLYLGILGLLKKIFRR